MFSKEQITNNDDVFQKANCIACHFRLVFTKALYSLLYKCRLMLNKAEQHLKPKKYIIMLVTLIDHTHNDII